MLLIALAAAAVQLPPPTPAQTQDIHCVALLAIVANEQKRGAGWADYPDLSDDGARYAGLVGEALVKEGRTRESVRDLILGQVALIQKAKTLPRTEVDQCASIMKARAPAPPPPALPRCAAIMALAYEAVKARDGLTKGARDLATLASVLAYHAREQLIGEGKSEAEADALIGVERAKAAKAGGAPDAELQGCASLAAPNAG